MGRSYLFNPRLPRRWVIHGSLRSLWIASRSMRNWVAASTLSWHVVALANAATVQRF